MKLLANILAVLLALGFLPSAAAKLLAAEQIVQNFTRWGYPSWFMYLTGVIELAGAILVVVPKTRITGCLVLGGTMLGAVATHLRAGEGIAELAPPLVLGALVAVVLVATLRGRAT